MSNLKDDMLKRLMEKQLENARQAAEVITDCIHERIEFLLNYSINSFCFNIQFMFDDDLPIESMAEYHIEVLDNVKKALSLKLEKAREDKKKEEKENVE